LTDSLENIILGCRRKEQTAQKLLYEHFSSRMYGVCLRYSGSSDDAQDILHEGFLKVFDKIDQYQSRGSFEGWIRRIMVNTALEKFRNQYRTVSMEDNHYLPDTNSHEDLNDNITAKELMQFIQELSPKYRVVFNMYAIEGYSHKEIGQMLDISEGTSKSNLSRARGILQEKVKMYYKETVRTG
jgi:RNA polymerase sigma-70 factor (ECF subfamily)